jgi:hypothetical protein
MSDIISVQVKYLSANGSVTTRACLVKAICTMHGEGGTGAVEFFDTAGTPDESAVAKCRIDVVGKGVFSMDIPEPGALFANGLYVKVPSSSSINVFFKDANYG